LDEQTPAGGVSFTSGLVGENAPAGTISKASFAGTALNLEHYDSDRLGTFTR